MHESAFPTHKGKLSDFALNTGIKKEEVVWQSMATRIPHQHTSTTSDPLCTHAKYLPCIAKLQYVV
jgi:hypothetical protein